MKTLTCDTGCVDAYGTVRYFNVSKTQVSQGDSITFKCGATLSQDEAEVHSLVVHIKKSFTGSQTWLLAVNEQVEIPSIRYDAQLRAIDQIREVEFTIMSKTHDHIDYFKRFKHKYVDFKVFYYRFLRDIVLYSNEVW